MSAQVPEGKPMSDHEPEAEPDRRHLDRGWGEDLREDGGRDQRLLDDRPPHHDRD